MKTLFTIGSFEESAAEPATLLIEIGETYCLVSCFNNAGVVQAMKVYTFALPELEESLQRILEKLKIMAGRIDKVIVSPAFPQALLVPQQFSSHDQNLLHTTFNVKRCLQMQDTVEEGFVTNVYSLPEAIYQQIIADYPSAVFVHAYTPLIKNQKVPEAAYQIAVHFVHNIFRVVVRINNHLQLVQTYTYSSPVDVAYYLLKICAEWQIPQEEVVVTVSGLVDENSALYKELYHYFIHIHFAETTFSSLAEDSVPNHFFASLHNLAICVS